MNILTVDPTKIKVKYDRIREDVGDLTTLKQSIFQYGQLQPIIVEQEGEDLYIIDGFRRLSSILELGLTTVACVLRQDVDEWMSRKIELEANIQRLDMTWQERVKAIAELDRLQMLSDPNWTQGQTAAMVGMHQKDVSNAKKVAKMVELYPDIGTAKSFAQALNMATQKAKQVLQRAAVDNKEIDYGNVEEKVLLGDSVEVIKLLPDGLINAIVTDPPFGVDYDQRTAGGSSDVNAYLDDRARYERILSMFPDMYRVLQEDGWLIWFCGMSWYTEVVAAASDAGFTVDPIPVIWDRTDGRTFTNRPDRYFTKGYDIAIHAFKGSPVLAQRGKPNILRIPPVAGSDRELLVERPVELYAELIRRLTIPGELVADFFAGSGSCPAAAASLGRDYLAVEMNPERRAFAIKKIASYTPDA